MNKCIVVDLDFTLINKNTFHVWMKFLFMQLVFKRPLLALQILYYVLLRVLRQISHSQLKYKIVKITNRVHDVLDMDHFIGIITMYTNEDIINRLKERNCCETWILATAAPEIYAKRIAEKYGFDYCCATSMDLGEEWEENIREVKLKNVYSILNELKIKEVDTLYTDHHDDIHIMKISNKIFLVNPSPKTIEVVKKLNIKYILS
ncbi:HAD family hydrolase [Geobacillus stearothermophilus]|nr:HAD family hydrolase [Geobacillus stearothermophilus]